MYVDIYLTCCSFLLVWTLYSVLCDNRPCAHFQLIHPEISSQELKAAEHTSLSLIFSVIHQSCKHFQDSSIEIDLLNADKKYTAVCSIILNNGSCSGTDNNIITCSCMLQNGLFSVKKTLVRTDNTTWRWKWWAYREKAADMYLVFNVLYPPRIKGLTANGNEVFNSYLVSRNQNVVINCLWVNGNPSSTVHLIHNNNILTSSSASNPISYHLQSTGCEDTGVIQCAAERAEKNVSIAFLVKCPPVFHNESAEYVFTYAGENVDLEFPFSAHDLNMTLCELYLCQNLNDSAYGFRTNLYNNEYISCSRKYLQCSTVRNHSHEDLCQCDVSGTPPFLMLNVRLYVQSGYSGWWRVTFSNFLGKNSHHFILKVGEVIERKTPIPTYISTASALNGTGTLQISVTLAVAIIAGIAIIIITVISAVVLKQRAKPTLEKREPCSHKAEHIICRRKSVSIVKYTPHEELLQEDQTAAVLNHATRPVDSEKPILFHLKENATGPDFSMDKAACIVASDEYLTPCIEQYSTLDSKRMNCLREIRNYSLVPSQEIVNTEINPALHVTCAYDNLMEARNSEMKTCIEEIDTGIGKFDSCRKNVSAEPSDDCLYSTIDETF